MLHTLNHAIGKSVLFLSSGDVVLGYRTREVAKVRGVLAVLPLTGAVLLLASLSIVGSPPFGLFLSELTILRAGFVSSGPWLPSVLLLLLVIAFIAFTRCVTGMVLGQPTPPMASTPSAGSVAAVRVYATGSQRLLAAAPLVVGMAGLLVLGLWIPSALHTAILGSIGALT